MKWLGLIAGLVVGSTFGFWLHDIWREATAIGASRPPEFDFYVPLILLVVAIAGLAAAGRRADA